MVLHLFYLLLAMLLLKTYLCIWEQTVGGLYRPGQKIMMIRALIEWPRLIIIYGPIAEEALYRLFPTWLVAHYDLGDDWYWFGGAITAIIFALSHTQYRLLASLVLFVPSGLVLTFICVAYSGMYGIGIGFAACLFVHCGVNLLDVTELKIRLYRRRKTVRA